MLLGVVGMLVAVPVAASIKIAITTFMPEIFGPIEKPAEPSPAEPAES
jgi:predicted PurR-regulated permease PerM